MKERNRLTIQMSLLFFVVLVFFGVIIVNEKLSPLKIPKVTEKITTYINENYKDILNNLEIQDVEYKELKYQTKVISKNNKNYYFYVYYKDKKITDTYKDDFLKGNSIISYQNTIIEENIKKKTKTNYKVSILKTLDNYTDSLKDKIITSTNPENLKIYNLNATLTPISFDIKHIANTIEGFDNNLTSKSITPKTYTITIIDTDNEERAVKITNLTTETINCTDFNNIINDIILDKKSNLLSTYNITYEYLN